MKTYLSFTITIVLVTLLVISIIYFDHNLLVFDKFKSRQDYIVALISIITAFLGLLQILFKDKSGMKVHEIPIEKDFPQRNFKERLKSYCNFLARDLDKIDQETNWSSDLFTPLDAEVEINSATRRTQKIKDMLKAIRANQKSKAFLVLGDPGSGKSVALRKLCRDLLSEVGKTGKVPIYINLKEWETEEPWSEEIPPKSEQLYNFVLNNLKERGDIFANKFLDQYFEKMFETGRIFLILDSFDEIPAVLDADESSWIVDQLSTIIYNCIAGAHESRGVLASRMYRRPTQKFNAETKLEIRPFTENKIIENIKKQLSAGESLVQTLFKDHPALVPIARNPFSNALILNFYEEQGRLPVNQAEIYETYIHRRLKDCEAKIKQKKLNEESILHFASEIAFAMFSNPKAGLEIELKDLDRLSEKGPVEDTMEILQFARLARLKSSNEKQFSFVHRRFAEYFLTRRIVEGKIEVPLEAIPSDSRWRDALVLYCEVAEETEAKRIAEYCWKEIKNVFGEKVNKWEKYLSLSEEKEELQNELKNYWNEKLGVFLFLKTAELGYKFKKFASKAESRILLSIYSKLNRLKYFVELYEDDLPEFEQLTKQINGIDKKMEKLSANEIYNINISGEKYLRVVHSLRFLANAFHSRLDCIRSFQAKLSNFINFVISNNNNLVATKIAVESIILARTKERDDLIITSFDVDNKWINETASRSCRYLSKISDVLERVLRHHFIRKPLKILIKSRKEILFSLSLSDAFIPLRKRLNFYISDLILMIFGFISLNLATAILIYHRFPYFLMLTTLVIFWLRFIFKYFVKDILTTEEEEAKDNIFFRFLPSTIVMVNFFYIVWISVHHSFLLNINVFVIILLLSISSLLIFPWYNMFYNYFRLILFGPLLLVLDVAESIFSMLNLISFGILPKIIKSVLDIYKYPRLFLKAIPLHLIFFLAVVFIITQIISFFFNLFSTGIVTSETVEGIYQSIETSRETKSVMVNIILILLGSGVLGFVFYKYIVPLWQGYTIFKKLEFNNIMFREKISEQFNVCLKFNIQLKFVRELEKRHIKAIGEWPDYKLPNHYNDPGSTLLAQLEERWLGLDR